MKRFIIERKLPGAANLTATELKNIAQTSMKVIGEMGHQYKWVESFVTDDKIYCIHEAIDEQAIREHSRCGNFPINTVEEVKIVISPATAE